MIVRIGAILATLFLAFGILFTSVFRTASVKYVFSQSPSDDVVAVESKEEPIFIDYDLAYPGSILPDHPLWSIKVLRDRVWLLLTTNVTKKAELKLLFADKRLGASKTLFEKDKPELAYTTLTKAEKYLEESMESEMEARGDGRDTYELLKSLANAALKHREVIDQILTLAPEDAKPGILKTRDYSTNVYKSARDALQDGGMEAPESPFEMN